MQAFNLILALLFSVISLTSAVAFSPNSVPFNHSHPTGRPSHSFPASWNSESISKFAESMTQWEEWTAKHSHNHTMTGMPSVTETGLPDATTTVHLTKTVPPTGMLVRDDDDHKSHTETAEPHPTGPTGALTGPKTFTGTYSRHPSGGLHRTAPHGAPTGPNPNTGNPSWTGPTMTGLHGEATGHPTGAPTNSWTTSFTKKIPASVMSDFAPTASMSPRDNDDDWHGCTLAIFRGGGRCIPSTKTTKLDNREVDTKTTRTRADPFTLPHAHEPSTTGEHTIHRSQHSSIWPAVTPTISQ